MSGINMVERKFDFWRDHSLNYLQMAFGYENHTRLPNPDGCGRRAGECGDTIEMFLIIKSGRIESISFDTSGCINTHLSGHQKTFGLRINVANPDKMNI